MRQPQACTASKPVHHSKRTDPALVLLLTHQHSTFISCTAAGPSCRVPHCLGRHCTRLNASTRHIPCSLPSVCYLLSVHPACHRVIRSKCELNAHTSPGPRPCVCCATGGRRLLRASGPARCSPASTLPSSCWCRVGNGSCWAATLAGPRGASPCWQVGSPALEGSGLVEGHCRCGQGCWGAGVRGRYTQPGWPRDDCL